MDPAEIQSIFKQFSVDSKNRFSPIYADEPEQAKQILSERFANKSIKMPKFIFQRPEKKTLSSHK